jgi:hypothetical protein
MTEENFFRIYAQIITAINYCILEKLTMPALVLIYSAIDSVSWVSSDNENQQVKQRFQTWVDTWMLQKYSLPCTSLELYAARCGILHTLTPDSDLSKKKGVRRIAYAWGTAKQKDLDEAIKLVDYPGLVAVHIDDIYQSFLNGFTDYLNSIQKDVDKRALYSQKASKYFANTEISTITEFLTANQKIDG